MGGRFISIFLQDPAPTTLKTKNFPPVNFPVILGW
jgi:hypothetical protein